MFPHWRIVSKNFEGEILLQYSYIFFYSLFFSLWAGVLPRVMWISIGGFIFLGVYDSAKFYLSKCFGTRAGKTQSTTLNDI